jgi:hypothetical protein
LVFAFDVEVFDEDEVLHARAGGDDLSAMDAEGDDKTAIFSCWISKKLCEMRLR